MRLPLIAMLALQAATLIYMLQEDSGITLGVQIGNVIYSAEFTRRAVPSDRLEPANGYHLKTGQ